MSRGFINVINECKNLTHKFETNPLLNGPCTLPKPRHSFTVRCISFLSVCVYILPNTLCTFMRTYAGWSVVVVPVRSNVFLATKSWFIPTFYYRELFQKQRSVRNSRRRAMAACAVNYRSPSANLLQKTKLLSQTLNAFCAACWTEARFNFPTSACISFTGANRKT